MNGFEANGLRSKLQIEQKKTSKLFLFLYNLNKIQSDYLVINQT